MSVYALAAEMVEELGTWLDSGEQAYTDDWFRQTVRFDRLMWFLGAMTWAATARTMDQARLKYGEEEDS